MSKPRLSVIPAGAVLDRRLMRGDLDVLCLLGISADTETGWCRRSQVKMAKQLEVARSTVQASINRLVDAGWVERRMQKVPGVQGERDSAHEYRVVLDVPDRPAPEQACENSPIDPCRSTGTPAGTPAGPADPDRHLLTVLTNDTIPHSVRNGGKPEREKPVRKILLEVLDERRADAVIAHRKAMRKPLTSHAADLLARRFSLMPDPNAAADAMVANGWQGFEPAWLEQRADRASSRAPPSNFQKRQADALSAFQQAQRGDRHDQHPAGSKTDLDLGPGDFQADRSAARKR